MDLIDWPAVARNALWILGLSVALAAWSYCSWWASVHDQRLCLVLDRPLFLGPFSAGMLLFAISLAWGATRGWERVLWAALGLAFGWQIVVAVRASRLAGPPDSARAESD